MLISFIWEVIRPVMLRQREEMNWLQWDSIAGKDRLQTGPSGLVLKRNRVSAVSRLQSQLR